MQDEPTGVPINRATRFGNKVGSTDVVVAGEPLLLLTRRFRQKGAWLELNRILKTNRKVKGFILNKDKVKGGYALGFITFYPFRRRKRKRERRQRRSDDLRFLIEIIKQNKKKD